MRRNRIVAVAALVVMALAMGTSLSGEKRRILRIGHPITEISHWHKGLLRFAELVDQKTNGGIKIEIYPNLTMGSEREMIEGMQLGSVDMGLVSTSITGPFTDSLLVTDLPFLFDSAEHARKVLNSEIGDELLASLESINIMGLAFYENGFRNITAFKPVRTLADIKGLKIRTVESPLYLETFEAFGANPVPMTWGDVYTALQQKTIDGLEGCNDNNFKAKMQEVAPYVSIVNQIYSAIYIGIGKHKWDELTPAEQKALKEAARESAVYEQKLAGEFEMTARENIRKNGGTVMEDLDLTEWRNAVKPIYAKWAKRAGGMERIERIRAMKP